MARPNTTSGHELTPDEFAYMVPNGATKPANEVVNNSTTLHTDSDLVLPTTANTTYLFKAVLYWTSGTTPDIKFMLAGPAGWGNRLMWETFSRASTQGSQLVDTRTTLTGDTAAISGQGISLSTQGQFTVVDGMVSVAATAGNVSLQWAQNTADASDTTLLSGSCALLTPMN